MTIDNYVYGVAKKVLKLHPFDVIKKLLFGVTHLYGKKTYRIAINSQDFEQVIILSTGVDIKPLFKVEDKSNSLVTSGHTENMHLIDNQKHTGNTIITDDFLLFCQEIVEDAVIKELVDITFESLEDSDMMIQSAEMLLDYHVDM